MDGYQRAARVIFGIGLIAMGILGLVYGDFAMQWQPVPAGIPWRTGLAYLCAAIELVLGLAFLIPRGARIASRVALVYVALWWLLLKIPGVVQAPRVEASWLGLGEITVILAGAWTLFLLYGHTEHDDVNPRLAAILFGLALIPIGLSHIFYPTETASLVPAWLPFRHGWAYVTGAAQVAAGLGVLFSIVPALAATLEATALTIFTMLVWVPGLFHPNAGRAQWTALVMSAMITAGAWAAAAGISLRRRDQSAPEA